MTNNYIKEKYGFNTVDELNHELRGQLIFDIWKRRAKGLINDQQYDDQIDKARNFNFYTEVKNEKQK